MSSAVEQITQVVRRSTVNDAMPHPFHAEDVDVDPEQARALIEAGEVQLVDVREPHEWDAGRIAGARHIELERLASEAESLDRDRPVLFYCRLGARSGMAANAFRRAGYDAYSIDGGLTEWDRRDYPLEPEDGTVADH
jgi:rhodanese-related sulfurtransferase